MTDESLPQCESTSGVGIQKVRCEMRGPHGHHEGKNPAGMTIRWACSETVRTFLVGAGATAKLAAFDAYQADFAGLAKE